MILITAGTGRVAAAVRAAVDCAGLADRVVEAVPERVESLEGVTQLVVVPTTDARATDAQMSLVTRAGRQGVERVHLISLAEAGERSPVSLLRRVGRLEHEVVQTGLEHTILRCTPFMQALPMFMRRDPEGVVLTGPFRDTAFPWLDAADAGALLAARLASGDGNLVCQLSGPEELDFEHVAALLSEALHERVRYVDLCWPEAQGLLEGAGFAPGTVRMFTEYWDYLASGVIKSDCCDTAARLLGRPPHTMAQYFERFAAEAGIAV